MTRTCRHVLRRREGRQRRPVARSAPPTGAASQQCGLARAVRPPDPGPAGGGPLLSHLANRCRSSDSSSSPTVHPGVETAGPPRRPALLVAATPGLEHSPARSFTRNKNFGETFVATCTRAPPSVANHRSPRILGSQSHAVRDSRSTFHQRNRYGIEGFAPFDTPAASPARCRRDMRHDPSARQTGTRRRRAGASRIRGQRTEWTDGRTAPACLGHAPTHKRRPFTTTSASTSRIRRLSKRRAITWRQAPRPVPLQGPVRAGPSSC